MESVADRGIEWRKAYQKDLLELLNIHAIIPNEGESLVKPSSVDMNKLKIENTTEFTEIMRRFITLDLALIDLSDIVIVRYEGEQLSGTTAEIHHCYMTEKPIYMISSLPLDRIPGWILSEIGPDRIFPQLPCLIGYLADQMFQWEDIKKKVSDYSSKC